VLLPAWCLARRADAAGVIGFALEAKAAGAGHRVVAGRLGRPASTVRGWLRAFTARAEQVRSVFTALAASLVTDPPLPAAALRPGPAAPSRLTAPVISAVHMPGPVGQAGAAASFRLRIAGPAGPFRVSLDW
jgi:hypothetical protein